VTPSASAPPLTLAALRAASVARAKRWHAGAEPWSGADWSNAMCGEAGEAANVVKKLRRQETGIQQPGPPPADLLAMLAKELADVVIYADLVAEHYGLDLSAAVTQKFNEVSDRYGFPERLGAPAAALPGEDQPA
jgi:NTP pyrophosphatase (non-canonical NTP hydrolase)